MNLVTKGIILAKGTFFVETVLGKGIIFVKISLANVTTLNKLAADPYLKFSHKTLSLKDQVYDYHFRLKFA